MPVNKGFRSKMPFSQSQRDCAVVVEDEDNDSFIGERLCKRAYRHFSLDRRAPAAADNDYEEVLDEGDDGNDSLVDHRDNDGSTFLSFFLNSDGPPQVIFLCMLLALAIGCTVGVQPEVITDRYARLNHGLDGDTQCFSYSKSTKPQACLDGSSEAQAVAAAASFVSNLLTFVSSSMVGSISDAHGRRGILLLGIFLSILPKACLVLLQIHDSMSPTWIYGFSGLTGCVNWVAIALSALSDVIPKQWRAPSFGLLLAGFSCGFAFSPLLALGLDHLGVSVLALGLLLGGFVFALCCLPETLPLLAGERAMREREMMEANDTRSDKVIRMLIRPMKELTILNRNTLFRLMATLAFFSGMSTSGDQTLLLYYAEDRLDFNDTDVAYLFMIIGIMGVFVQGVLLKPVNDCLGERLVIVVAFLCGAIHNAMYSFASDKRTIFFAILVSCVTGMSFPTISAIKSNNVEEHEQGRIQGALYSLSSLASALGPVILRLAYSETKDTTYPGTFFLVASFFFIIAACCAFALPKDQANSEPNQRRGPVPFDDEVHPDSYGTTLL